MISHRNDQGIVCPSEQVYLTKESGSACEMFSSDRIELRGKYNLKYIAMTYVHDGPRAQTQTP